jgi:hypothetical protein
MFFVEIFIRAFLAIVVFNAIILIRIIRSRLKTGKFHIRAVYDAFLEMG